MSTQKSQSHKRQEQNNTEWLDELINKIESMKNKISNTYQSFFFFFKIRVSWLLLNYLEGKAKWDLGKINLVLVLIGNLCNYLMWVMYQSLVKFMF